MDKFRFPLFWKGYCNNGISKLANLAITRERSIIFQIHELKSKKTWLEAYRNSYLHFIDPSAAVAVYTNTHTTVYLACACAQRHNNYILLTGGLHVRMYWRNLQSHRREVLHLYLWPWVVFPTGQPPSWRKVWTTSWTCCHITGESWVCLWCVHCIAYALYMSGLLSLPYQTFFQAWFCIL